VRGANSYIVDRGTKRPINSLDRVKEKRDWAPQTGTLPRGRKRTKKGKSNTGEGRKRGREESDWNIGKKGC